MCDVIIPVLIGVGALALLGGANSGDCGPCAVGGQQTASGYSITIPQQVGDVTNGVPGGQVAYAAPVAYDAPVYQASASEYAPINNGGHYPNDVPLPAPPADGYHHPAPPPQSY